MQPFVDDLCYLLKPSLWAEDILDFHPDDIQRKLLDSAARNVIVCCHRQFGKSTIASLMALHRALYYPGSLVLLVAHALRQAQEDYN